MNVKIKGQTHADLPKHSTLKCIYQKWPNLWSDKWTLLHGNASSYIALTVKWFLVKETVGGAMVITWFVTMYFSCYWI